MKSNGRTSAPTHTCPKCIQTWLSEKQATDCCDPEFSGNALPADDHGPYRCGDCGKGWSAYSIAGKCCDSDHVLCPIAELPDDAYLGHDLDYSYGKVFTRNWELVFNRGPKNEAVRVYPLHPLVAKMVEDIHRTRNQEGIESAQKQMRVALGITQESAHG